EQVPQRGDALARGEATVAVGGIVAAAPDQVQLVVDARGAVLESGVVHPRAEIRAVALSEPEHVDEEVADDLLDGDAGGERGSGRIGERVGLSALTEVEELRPLRSDEPEVAHMRLPHRSPSQCIDGADGGWGGCGPDKR